MIGGALRKKESFDKLSNLRESVNHQPTRGHLIVVTAPITFFHTRKIHGS